MNYAIILVGGKGTRMGNTGVPKQFMTLNNKPIIIYTIENVLYNSNIDNIIVVCNPDYIAYMNDLLQDYKLTDKVEVTNGGKDRLNSTLNGIKYIQEKYGINNDDIFMAHDSVRPFTNKRIFEENINFAKETKAATTVFDLTETIVETNESGDIFKLYPRNNLFSGQSPQTFNIKYFLECTSKIPDFELDKFTDLSNNIIYCGGVVKPVYGDRNNIKITHPIDLIIANSIINEKQSTEIQNINSKR